MILLKGYLLPIQFNIYHSTPNSLRAISALFGLLNHSDGNFGGQLLW